MRTPVTTTLALLMAFCLASGAYAQGGMGPGGGAGWCDHGCPQTYDPKTVETVSGEVISVDQVHGKGWGQGRGGRGGGYGVHLTLKSDKGEIAILLGPNWYVDQQSLKIGPKDQIVVRGSRVMFEGKAAIIAAEVKKGDRSLKLRSDTGLPMWQGQGRRRP